MFNEEISRSKALALRSAVLPLLCDSYICYEILKTYAFR